MANAGSGTSFSRNPSSTNISSSSSSPHGHGIKRGPNSAAYVSSGIPDLDKILGGGYLLGSLVMVVEDAEAPHHLLLLRNFMSQGLVHRQPLLYASPSENPNMFLGTLPSPLQPPSPSSGERSPSATDAGTPDADEKERGLRIAWQYKKYFGEQRGTLKVFDKGNTQNSGNDFDLRKPLDRKFLASEHIECVSLLKSFSLDVLHEHCSKFLVPLSRVDERIGFAGRIAIQSLCSPQCDYYDRDWDMLSFLRSLRALVRSCNAVAVVTFPASVLSASMSKRWQHLADTLLHVKAIPDEDKELAKLLNGYQDMIGLLYVHKVAQFNTQVPVILEVSTFSIKLQKRRSLILERLNQAPVNGSAGCSSETSGGCSGSSRTSSIDF